MNFGLSPNIKLWFSKESVKTLVFSEGACDRFNKIDAVLENAAISITVLMTAANIIILSLYCIEIIIVPLKNRIVETNVFGWKKYYC